MPGFEVFEPTILSFRGRMSNREVTTAFPIRYRQIFLNIPRSITAERRPISKRPPQAELANLSDVNINRVGTETNSCTNETNKTPSALVHPCDQVHKDSGCHDFFVFMFAVSITA